MAQEVVRVDNSALLRAMWRDGVPLRVIAARMKITTAAVSSRAQKLGLPRRSAECNWNHDRFQQRRAALRREFKAERDDAETTTRTLLTLRHGECAWPVGEPNEPDFGYCGAPVVSPGKSYCGRHLSRGTRA